MSIMEVMATYTIKQLRKDFPTDTAIAEMMFDAVHSRECSCGGTYKKCMPKKFQCGKCRKQISPTAGTIFHKSDTPLTDWVYAIYMFSQAKTGLAATELQRHLGCTYKTAWRMLNKIRKSVPLHNKELTGTVEIDEAYIGGKTTNKRKFKDKEKVLSAISRDDKKVVTAVVDDFNATTTRKFINEKINRKAKVYTDGAARYNKTIRSEREVDSVNHSKKEYVRGDVHINSVENFWSHLKRSIKGTHTHISEKYAQEYVNAFSFHYNNAYNDKARFSLLLSVLTGGVVMP